MVANGLTASSSCNGYGRYVGSNVGYFRIGPSHSSVLSMARSYPASTSCHGPSSCLGRITPHPGRRGRRSGLPAGEAIATGIWTNCAFSCSLSRHAVPGASEPEQTEILLRPAVGSQVRHPGLDHGRGDNRIVWIHLDTVGAPLVDDRHCGRRRWRGSHAFRPFFGCGALERKRGLQLGHVGCTAGAPLAESGNVAGR